MTPAAARRLLTEVTDAWVADAASDVVWAGDYEGRRGLRMAQRGRDYTTIWFDIGDRTVGCEAYVLPKPPRNATEVYRQCLVRNAAAWRVAFALDRHGDVVLRGRVPLPGFDAAALDELVGAVYEMVEISFRPMARAAFATREKSG